MPAEIEKTILEILTNIPVFQGLGPDDLRLIMPLLERVSFPTGTSIIKEGGYGDSMYIIIQGTVTVTKGEGSNDEVSLGPLYAGSYFGELSLIDNMPRSASVITIEDTEMFILKKENFDALLEREQKIAINFYRNCLKETFSRFRGAIANFTFSQHTLHQKTNILDEINRDLTLAKKVQSYFLNTENLEQDEHGESDIRHSYIYHPCSEIGGDFINIAKLEEGYLGIIIADVMGHGITAALATGVLKSAFSIYLENMGLKPVMLMTSLNSHFLQVISELYATCYYALINQNTKTITFTKAGHHHPLFWKTKDQDLAVISCTGNGLGIMKEAKFGQARFTYEPGDKLLLFTDGIIEQTNKDQEMYSEARLRALFKDLIKSGEKKLLNVIFNDLKEYTGSMMYEDDITMLLLEF